MGISVGLVIGCSGLDLSTPASGFNAADETDVDAVASRVEIVRDEYGVPHIEGQDVPALFFGVGYAQAEDHVHDIARSLVMARGKGAKYFGEESLENDFSMKRLDNSEQAAKDLGRISAEFRDVVEFFAHGVNHYIDGHAEDLPGWIDEAHPFSGADVLALIRSRSIREILTSENRLTDVDLTKPQVGKPILANSPGSNAFAISGSRTTSGHSMLLANPHLMWSALYWEAHIKIPGKLNFFGNTLAGYPVLWAGFNESLGWANTVNHAKLEHIYAFRRAADNPLSYEFEDEVRSLVEHDVEVEIRNAEDHISTETRRFYESHVGPVVGLNDDYIFSVKSTRLDATLDFEGFYRLAQTKNLDEFLAVFNDHPVFSCNFLYADGEDNIGYIWQANVPVFGDGVSYDSTYTVAHSRNDIWQDIHDFTDMPVLINPEHGVVGNANNPPWWPAAYDWIDAEDYPPYFEQGALQLRPQLGFELLEETDAYSVRDVIDLTFNTRLLLAERVLPDLLRALRSLPETSANANTALSVLEAWDQKVAAESAGAVLFKRFWDLYAKDMEQPYRAAWSPADPLGTPRGLADPERAIDSLEEAVSWAKNNYGSASVAWGKVNRIRSKNLDLPGDGAHGSYGTFHVMSYAPSSDGLNVMGFVDDDVPLAGFGANWIMLVEFSKPVQAWAVLATGQSGDYDSAHHDDQLELFHSHQLRPVWFTNEEIARHEQRRYRP